MTFSGNSLEQQPAELAGLAIENTLNNSSFSLELNVDVPATLNLNEEARLRRLELIREAVEGRK
ncbi:hypothetical protein VC623_22800 [Citrobacter amalonaticus]|uniref:hypothetical protein n=1 Tax=Citrobacter amalonaticus TaxID=35703 RepID=UPI00292C13EC|nr:hypothetical protein [Citrobacter amalonaticus]MDV0787439.1 hypothetical protein [Citrobacter amalonaticus]MEB0643503.1 hypothetical protein [Citrobacter amalonaticus]